MSDHNYTNIFNISGDNNEVNFTQDIDAGSDGAEMLGMVLKFLFTILLSPVLIPAILAMNGYKLMQGQGQLEDGDYGNE